MNKYIEKVTVYSTKPILGKFKYKDILIQPSELIDEKNFPVEIQFTVESDEPYFRYSNNNRDLLSKKIIELEFLLSLFTQFYFYDFSKSELYLTEYNEKEIINIKRDKIKWYQDKSMDDRNVEQIVFPEQMEMLLDKYFSLSGKDKEVFQKSLSLFYKSISIKPENPSLSFLCLVTSIEAISQIEFKEKNKKIEECHQCHTVKASPWTCEKCSAPLWGISKKYKLFITKYCFGDEPTNIDNQFLNKIYNIRSKMVHYGEVLQIDDFWDDENWNWEESFLHKDLLKFTRIALINWLMMNA